MQDDVRIRNVAVLFGGRSVEHEISIITALQLMAALDVTRYRVIPVYIAPSGRWYTGASLFDRAFYKQGEAALRQLVEVTLLPIPAQPGLRILRRGGPGAWLRRLIGAPSEFVPVDVYLPAFHGDYGEDGCIQGLLELADAYFSIPDASRRPNSPLYEWLKTELEQTGARGVIFHHYIWCDAWRAEFTRLKEWVDLPVLGLDSDSHNETSLARSQTRIRAFLEMLL